MCRKITIEYVKEYMLQYGYICLSDTFIRSRDKLSINCPQGHIYEANWNTFQQGRRCRICSIKQVGEKRRLTIRKSIDGARYKKCPMCGTYLPYSDFFFDNNTCDKLSGLCKKCKSLYTNKWVKDHVDNRNMTFLKSHLKIKFNMTLDDYFNLLNNQNGKCAICGSEKSQTVLSHRLYLDHDHTTNKVRGLLCQKCNTLLGYARESIEILLSAVEYLRKNKHKQEQVYENKEEKGSVL
jgi:hypothetical protein